MIKLISLSSDFLATCDTSMVEDLVEDAEKDPELVRMFQGSLGFHFSDHQQDELMWIDPQIRAWGRQLYEHVSHLLYYMSADPRAGAMALLATSFAHPEMIEGTEEAQVTLEANELLLPIYAEHLVAAAVFAERMADDWRPIVDEFVDNMDETLGVAVRHTVEASLALSK